MSHLGDRLSALIDGELDGAERDRAHAHLAGCDQCRIEAAELRALKRRLGSLLPGAPAEAAMTRRLIAMTGPGGPLPPRRRLLRPAPAPRRETRRPWPEGPVRRRYLVFGTVFLVVGLSTAAFTAGGAGSAPPGPRITPPVEMYSVEHAITTGQVPFTGPSPRSSVADTAGPANGPGPGPANGPGPGPANGPGPGPGPANGPGPGATQP
jgi:anti-sigma factor RsiW